MHNIIKNYKKIELLHEYKEHRMEHHDNIPVKLPKDQGFPDKIRCYHAASVASFW